MVTASFAVALALILSGNVGQSGRKVQGKKTAQLTRKAQALAPRTAGPGNAILIEDMGKRDGQPSRRPFTISRVFAMGEFPECAQANVSGLNLETQCDAKSRWPDNSLKHAILTFWNELPAGSYMQVDFMPIACRQPDGALTREQILQYLGGNWGGVVDATANVGEGGRAKYSANVREILEAWTGEESDLGVRYWLKGPLVTQIIVEDRSQNLPYDFGWKSDLPGLLVGKTVNPTDQTVQIHQDSAANIGKWQFPMTAYLGDEKFKICSAAGLVLSVCEKGRGVDGTRIGEQRVNWYMIPDSGWNEAKEDKYRSLHPQFIVTIYPGWDGVKVDAIMENAWTTKLQDQIYTARVGRGAAGEETVWQKPILHAAKTRWRKTFWNGSELPPTRVDHNFPYLVYTNALPSFDQHLKVAPEAVRYEQELFGRTGKGEVGTFGVWNPRMPDPGGRGELALIPRWYLIYLYTSDYTLQQGMYANADVSAFVPIHFRESLNERRQYLPGQDISAFGRPVSIDARPTVITRADRLDLSDVKLEDRITPVGVVTTGGWYPDQAHQPSMTYVPYLLSGDWYYLEEMQFWSAFNLAYGTPGTCQWCRLDSVGYIYGSTELRSEAWVLRNLAQTAFSTPDGAAEKTYFETKLLNNIAIRDGRFEVTDSYYYEPQADCPAPCASTLWRYGRDFDGRSMSNPLHFPMIGSDGLNEAWLIDGKLTFASGIPWQGNFMHVVNKHIEELGYAEIAPQRRLLASNIIQMLQHPDFNGFLAGEYLMPTRKQPGQGYFTNWADVLKGFNPAFHAVKEFPETRINSPAHYPYMLNAAASCVTMIDDPQGYSGAKAYKWVNSRIKNQLYAQDPSWALVPRPGEMPVEAGAEETARLIQPKWYKKPASRGRTAAPAVAVKNKVN